MTTFREAIEARDIDAVCAMLAEDVVFTSPVAFEPYTGRALVTAIVRGAMRVFEDLRYEVEIGPEGRDHVLIFRARVGERELQGCDILHLDEDGLIDHLTVLVRPLSAARGLAEAMGEQFEAIRREAQRA